MLLHHVHLPHITSYSHAAKLQQTVVTKFLAHKANPATTPHPSPTVVTAQFHPIYTCGRREIGALSQQQKDYLTQSTPWGKAEFHEALRGGQTTFHGPGQLVAYPILDLKRHGLSARCYVHLLEACVMQTCEHYGVKTRRTDNPGVWVNEDNKIAALGVHLRRNVSSHGVGLNVTSEPLPWFGRIVACGLEGKGTTSLEKEGGVVAGGVDELAEVFVRRMAKELLDVDGVDVVGEGNVDRV